MLRRVFVVALVLVVGLSVGVVAAQEMKPGPEHARLAYFVASWRFEGQAAPSPFGPGGKYSGAEMCEWFSGKFAIICHATSQGPMGELKSISLMSYDPEEKVYTYFGVDSRGSVDTSKGQVAGDTWTWTGEGKVKGKPYKFRMAVKEISPDLYTFKAELSEDSVKWAVIDEGKSTKVKAPQKSTK
jgi:hypothetical protein